METIQENETTPTIIKKCSHNKRKSVCVECGGASICEHGKIKKIRFFVYDDEARARFLKSKP